MENTIKEKLKQSKTFCILPFVHLYVHPDGKIAPCCIGEPFENGPNLKTSSVEQLVNSAELKEVREFMAEGKEHSACQVCYNDERIRTTSQRTHSNEKLNNGTYTVPNIELDYTVPAEIQHLDIRFSNLCNLKCRMCNPTYSSMWYEDWSKLYVGSPKAKTKLVKADENAVEKIKPYITKLKTIYFAGGEPLLMKEHMDTLVFLHETYPDVELPNSNGFGKDLQFHYNTNLHVLKYDGEGFIEKWKDFRRVNLSISCDGIGPVGEYQRTGFKTERLISNLNTLVEKGFKPLSYVKFGGPQPRLNYNFQYTVTPLNIYHIFEFIDFLLENNYIENDYDVDFRYAWTPSEHTVRNMPDEYKTPALEFLIKQRARKMSSATSAALESLISYIQEPPQITPDTFHKINKRMEELTSTDNEHTYLDFLTNNFKRYQ